MTTKRKKAEFEYTECASYLAGALQPDCLKANLKNARAVLRRTAFDVIAVTGVSGLCFGAPLAYLMGKPLVVVRKAGELPRPHSWQAIEGPDSFGSYLVVDDLVDSGATLKRIQEDISREHPTAKCVGIYCYLQTPSKGAVGLGVTIFPCVPTSHSM